MKYSSIVALIPGLCLATACSQVEPPRPAERLSTTLRVDIASVAISDAAFECSTRLLPQANGMNDTPVNRADPVFAEFLDRRGLRNERQESPRAGAFEMPSFVASADINPCVSPDPIAEDATATVPAPGLCRAAFNYCLGNELAMKARSFANVPANVAGRTAIHELARDRFQRSASEYLISLGYYTSACGTSALGRDRAADPTFPTTATAAPMCDRLVSGSGSSLFAKNVQNQMADAVLQSQSLLQQEVSFLMAQADAASTYGSTGSGVGASIWGLVPATQTTAATLGSRIEAASRIMGDADALSGGFTGSTTADLPEHTAVDAVPVGRSSSATDPDTAMALLAQYVVPAGIRKESSGRTTFASNRLEAAYVKQVYNLLDHRIAADQTRVVHGVSGATYDYDVGGAALRNRAALTEAEFVAFGSATLLGTESPLRSQFSIDPEDVRAALALLRDVLTGMSPEHAYVDQVTMSAGITDVAVRMGRVEQRSPLLLAAALADDPFPSSLHRVKRADARSPMLPPTLFGDADALANTTLDSTDWTCALGAYGGTFPWLEMYVREERCDAKNWYDWNYARLNRLGAAGALHIMRVYMRRLRSITPSTSVDVRFIDNAQLDSLLTSVEGSIGVEWTETESYGPAIAYNNTSGNGVCTPNAFASCMSGYTYCSECDYFKTGRSSFDAGWRNWRTYLRSDSLGPWADANAKIVVGWDERAVRCLTSGNDGSGVDGFCTSVLTDTTEHSITSGTAAPMGMVTREASIALAPSPTASYDARQSTHAYIFLRTGAAAPFTYRLVDVVYRPTRPGAEETSEVHPFGGDYLRLFASLLARRPENPVLPLHNSIGISNTVLPPLENELVDNGNGVEDSYATHLARAESAVEAARVAVTSARNAEFELIRDGRADETTIRQAADEEQTTSTLLCGSAASSTQCAVARTTSVTMRELGLIEPYNPANPTGAVPADPLGYAPSGTPPTCEVYLRNFVAPPPGTGEDGIA